MSTLSDLLGLFSSSGGTKAARRAYNAITGGIGQAGQDITSATGQAIGTEQGAQQNAINALMQGQQQGTQAYQAGLAPYQALSSQAGGFLPLFAGALGAGTPQENAAAQGAFQASPGYQYTLGQGLEGLSRVGASTGQLGQTNEDAMQFAQNLANQDYQQWLNNLFQGVGVEQNAAQGIQTGEGEIGNLAARTGAGIGSIYGDIGQQIAALQSGQGKDLAQLALGKGQAGANLQQQIFGAQQGAGANTLNALFGLGGILAAPLTGGASLGASLGKLFGGGSADPLTSAGFTQDASGNYVGPGTFGQTYGGYGPIQ